MHTGSNLFQYSEIQIMMQCDAHPLILIVVIWEAKSKETAIQISHFLSLEIKDIKQFIFMCMSHRFL